jgi:hypothetical protein
MKLNMFRATHRLSSGAQNFTGSLWPFTRRRLVDVVRLCLTTSTNYTSNNPPRIENQSLPAQPQAPDDGRCVAQNMLIIIIIIIYILTAIGLGKR